MDLRSRRFGTSYEVRGTKCKLGLNKFLRNQLTSNCCQLKMPVTIGKNFVLTAFIGK